jgi:putative transposase
VKLDFIQPGKPTQNAHVESFNGRFRDECLAQNRFPTLPRAKVEIELYRLDYNCHRPHSSLNYQTPKAFGVIARSEMLEQVHPPEREGAFDFTDATELGVTIAGQVFAHLLFQFVLVGGAS